MWKIGQDLSSGGEGVKENAGLTVSPPSLLPPTGHKAHGHVLVSAAPVHQLIQIESPQEGIVTWKTYHTYIKASGGLV